MLLECNVDKRVQMSDVFGVQIQELQRRSLSFCFQSMISKETASCPSKTSLPYSGRLFFLALMKKVTNLCNNRLDIKGIVHSKMKILSVFTHPHVAPTP